MAKRNIKNNPLQGFTIEDLEQMLEDIPDDPIKKSDSDNIENFEILEIYGILAKRGMTRKFCLVDWNGEIKYDIRAWKRNMTLPCKGITFTEQEIDILRRHLRCFDVTKEFGKYFNVFRGKRECVYFYEKLCTLYSEVCDGVEWNKEVNVIDWGNGKQIDIRFWNENHSEYKEGISLSIVEIIELVPLLENLVLPSEPINVSDTEEESIVVAEGERGIPLDIEKDSVPTSCNLLYKDDKKQIDSVCMIEDQFELNEEEKGVESICSSGNLVQTNLTELFSNQTGASHILIEGVDSKNICSLSRVLEDFFIEKMDRTVSYARLDETMREGDIAAFLTNIPDKGVFIHKGSDLNLNSKALNVFKEALEDRKLTITIGAGSGAREVIIDLPEFTFIACVSEETDSTLNLRNCFGGIFDMKNFDDAEGLKPISTREYIKEESEAFKHLLKLKEPLTYFDIVKTHSELHSFLTNKICNYVEGEKAEHTLIICPYRNLLTEIQNYVKNKYFDNYVELMLDEFTTPGEIMQQISYIPEKSFAYMDGWYLPKSNEDLPLGCEAWVTWEALDLFTSWMMTQEVDFRYVSKKSWNAFQDVKIKLPYAPVVYLTQTDENIPSDLLKCFNHVIKFDVFSNWEMCQLERKIILEEKNCSISDQLFEKLVWTREIKGDSYKLSLLLNLLSYDEDSVITAAELADYGIVV